MKDFRELKIIADELVRRNKKEPADKDSKVDKRPATIRIPEHLHATLSNRVRDQIVSISDYHVEFKNKSRLSLPRIPKGYFFKGGAARESLRRFLFPNLPHLTIRDLDLFRYVNTSDVDDHALASHLMKSDYNFGKGIEVVENQKVYLATRDITLNEVLCNYQKILCSRQCLDDILLGILRPTSHVMNKYGELDNFTAMKILRFAAEKLVRGVSFKLYDLPPCTTMDPFPIALNLERSYAMGTEIGEEFVTLAWEYRAILPELKMRPTAKQIVDDLASRIPQGRGYFRHALKRGL